MRGSSNVSSSINSSATAHIAFRCNICRKPFSSRSLFNKHCRDVHLASPNKPSSTSSSQKEIPSRKRRSEKDEEEAEDNHSKKIGPVSKKMRPTREATKNKKPTKTSKNKKSSQSTVSSISSDSDTSESDVDDSGSSSSSCSFVPIIVRKKTKTKVNSTSGKDSNNSAPSNVKNNSKSQEDDEELELTFKVEFTKDGRFICPITDCRERFKTKGTFKNHLEIHEGFKPFVCPYCQFGFEECFDLVEHVSNEHTNERHFECGKCGQTYKLRKNLEAHKQKCPKYSKNSKK